MYVYLIVIRLAYQCSGTDAPVSVRTTHCSSTESTAVRSNVMGSLYVIHCKGSFHQGVNIVALITVVVTEFVSRLDWFRTIETRWDWVPGS